MSKLWLTVEVSPGASIGAACDEAVALASKTGLTIWFSFNGVKCLARAEDDPSRLEADWSRVMASKGRGAQIASDRGGTPSLGRARWNDLLGTGQDRIEDETGNRRPA